MERPSAAKSRTQPTSALALARASRSDASTSAMVAGCDSGVDASTFSIVPGIPLNGIFRSRKASTATSSAAFSAMQCAPPFSAAS